MRRSFSSEQNVFSGRKQERDGAALCLFPFSLLPDNQCLMAQGEFNSLDYQQNDSDKEISAQRKHTNLARD
jgi:hypothetical protein